MSIPIIIEREHLGAIAVSLARRKKQSEGATRSLHDPLLFLFKRRVIAQWKEPKTCAYSYTTRPISWLLCRIRCVNGPSSANIEHDLSKAIFVRRWKQQRRAEEKLVGSWVGWRENRLLLLRLHLGNCAKKNR